MAGLESAAQQRNEANDIIDAWRGLAGEEEGRGLPLVVRDCFDHAFHQRPLRDATTRPIVRDAILTGIKSDAPSAEEAVVHKALICCGLDASERLYTCLFDHILPPLEAAVRSTDTKRNREIRFMQGARIGLEREAGGKFVYHGEPISAKLVVCDFLMTMFIHQMMARDRHLTRAAKGDLPREWQHRPHSLPDALETVPFWANKLNDADQALQQSAQEQSSHQDAPIPSVAQSVQQ